MILLNAAVPNCVLGFANSGVLNKFNASARNSALNLSAIAKFLNSETSQFTNPGPRLPIDRATFPNE